MTPFGGGPSDGTAAIRGTVGVIHGNPEANGRGFCSSWKASHNGGSWSHRERAVSLPERQGLLRLHPDRRRCLLVGHVRQAVTTTIAVALAACASTQVGRTGAVRPAPADAATIVATSAAEDALLARLDDLRAGVETDADGRPIQIGPAYLAASGRTCRSLRGTEPAAAIRLACRDSQRWFLVPVPFGTASADAGTATASDAEPLPPGTPIHAAAQATAADDRGTP